MSTVGRRARRAGDRATRLAGAAEVAGDAPPAFRAGDARRGWPRPRRAGRGRRCETRIVERDDEIAGGGGARCGRGSPPTGSAGRTARSRRNRGRAGPRPAAAAACIAQTPGMRRRSSTAGPVASARRGRAARRPARPGRRCRHRPSETSATRRPAAARSSASGRAPPPRRARCRCRRLPAASGRAGRDRAGSRRCRSAAASSRVGFGGAPGRRARADADDRQPAARRGRSRSHRSARARGRSRRWRARLVCFGTTRSPPGPAAASAAPSATPQQPVARNAASEGRSAAGSRPGAVRPRRTAPARRAPRASASTAGSSAFSSTETTPATASRRQAGRGQGVARQSGDLLGRTPALAADAERQAGADGRPARVAAGGIARSVDDDRLRRCVRAQPARRAASRRRRPPRQRDRLAGEQRGGDRLDALGVGDAPAGRRLVERDAEAADRRRW